MRFGPPVTYARSRDGAHLAYQVLGEGELDLVFLLGWPTHLALLWEHPLVAGFLSKLAAFSRLILVDRLGNGMSDRGPTGHTFEDWMDEVRSVLAAVGSQRAAFFGCHLGGRLALLLAAAHPEQASAVVAFGSHPATLRDVDYPWGTTPAEREHLLAAVDAGTADPDWLLAAIAPGEAADAATRRWWTTFLQSAVSPAEASDWLRGLGPVDIRQVLGSIQVPTLVLHRTGDRIANVHASRYMAQRLPNARFVELAGDDHFPFFGDQDAVVALTQEFLTGTMPVLEPDRVLATMLFTDIVNSTKLATQLGDRRWHRLLKEHNAVVRANLTRFRGREVKTTGDGFLATFDGPARAIRAADAIRAELADHDLRIRVGLHTGECELLGADIGGSRCISRRGCWPRLGPASSCARGRSRTWSPGLALRSPTVGRTGSKVSPTSGSCMRCSSPSADPALGCLGLRQARRRRLWQRRALRRPRANHGPVPMTADRASRTPHSSGGAWALPHRAGRPWETGLGQVAADAGR